MLPHIPSPLQETSADLLEFPRLRELVAGYCTTGPGREWTLALCPSGDRGWAEAEQARGAETLGRLREGHRFDFHGLIDPEALLDRARIPGAVLEIEEVQAIGAMAEGFRGFQREWGPLLANKENSANKENTGPHGFESTPLQRLAAPLLEARFSALFQAIEGKFDPDGSVADHASPELARIRRRMERQRRAIEEGLQSMLRRLAPEGALQEDLITIRGERFVLPVKAEWKRRVPGVLHGSSSTGQTFFIEPLETIEQNNELQRMLEEEQAEVWRILAEMTRQIAAHADAIGAGARVLAAMDSLFARARFAMDFGGVAPLFSSAGSERITLQSARHPLLERRLRDGRRDPSHSHKGEKSTSAPGVPPLQMAIPLDLEISAEAPQLVISGPNAGGKTVALKTVGLFALMAQSGIPVPAEAAEMPLFDAVLADIGDAQSIAQDLSTFSAHIVRLNEMVEKVTSQSLVLLDELGSATDPEEGAALAGAIASHFLERRAWCLISTHQTSLKVYAANTPGTQNAAAGFDEATFAPTYRLRVGVPGVSAGIHIAERLGLAPAVVAGARARLGKQPEEIARFLDRLHADLLAVNTERAELERREGEVENERRRLEREGSEQQRRKLQEMEQKLTSLLKEFEVRMEEKLRGMGDRTEQQKAARQTGRAFVKLERDFAGQMRAAAVAHRTGADIGDPNAEPHLVREVKPGDTVRLRSLGKNVRVERQLDADTFEVSAGALRMRIRRDDIAEAFASADVTRASAPGGIASSRGIRVARANVIGTPAGEINVIGQTAEEAIDAVEKFLDQAFLDGLPRVRVVHGVGMGILRKALRAYLSKHPQVAAVSEPPQNQGGGGVTMVELRQ